MSHDAPPDASPGAGRRTELAGDAHRQHGFIVRSEWGPAGADALADADIAVVVDVLSFTTTVTVAAERGIAVHPFPWKDERARRLADDLGAVLAAGRQDAQTTQHGGVISLSPAAMMVAEGVHRVVLPSPNGSMIAARLAGTGTLVAAASLRNATAVAAWVVAHLRPDGSVAVIPAGERWPDGSLRPAVEDLWGAGAVISALADLGLRDASPEARTAAEAFRSVRHHVGPALAQCSSGRELIRMGFGRDLDVAADVDSARVVPVLVGGAFVAWTWPQPVGHPV